MNSQFVQQNAVEFKAHHISKAHLKKKTKKRDVYARRHKHNFWLKKHDSTIKPLKYKSLAIPNNTIQMSLSELCIAGYIAEHTQIMQRCQSVIATVFVHLHTGI